MDDNTSDLFAGSDAPGADALTLGNYAEQAYLSYAVSVVKSRALPDVCDGQKPVQRRILFAMNEMGLGPDAKPVKSARVVGDVLGKYHPHGDQSAYDALVRLAQDFSLRYPLIDGQGNFGSRDGDGAAAMRYTEARLTPISKLLLDEIDQGTVDFMPNYDGSFEEPKTLPSRMPFVLLNGASGIAVGLATEIPSHNLREVAAAAVALIRNPKLSHAELMNLIPGPDFPGGGQIISSDAEIAAAYETGRGSLKVRARWKIEDLARGQWQLVVTELPPNTSGQKVLEEIEELTNPKLKLGKKTLTPEQLNTKKAMLDLLDAVRDESGKEAAVRLVFEPKSRTIDQTEFVNSLLAHTSLESNATLNLVMIGADGRPGQKGLLTILDEWVKFRQQTMTRRCRHRLGKVDDRIHILEGRMIVFLNIDEVIRIIRESDEPKAALMSAFGLTERQAEDILEIRLRQLARLEKIKIEKELEALRDEKAKLEELLANDNAMKRLMIKEIEADAKQYGDERRTLIQQEKRATFEAKVVDEPVTVVVSQKGWVRALKGHGLDPASFSFKAGDSLYAAFQCRTPDRLIAWGSSGRVYSVDVSVLPGGRGDGVPVTSLIELESGSHLMHYYAAAADQPLLLASSNGFGFIAKVGDMVSRVKAGKAFMTIDAGAVPLAPMPVLQNATQVACLSSGGRLLVFGIDEMKTLSGGGRGVTLMALDDKETLVQALAIDPAGVVLIGTGRGGKVQDETLSYAGLAPHIGKRARKGRAPDTKLKVVNELRPLLG
ncbi:DNA topoisomerase IV subunit A [Burkholderia pseudomultivorans]|uniref:DNA topoisomerase 4 subunit A n=1 Tax=Burkholderia pseudomultivorans TaxID=1207504 RepID=A0A6P2R8W8_9BURK|nr:DNA topoisomerase IV subunit A [Burkholderia pseudomultivorans]MDR8731208.1 DNA topoisomerase 4 subunit A [Burkholderia pseudomultivorans]MDR8739037.1 DNA topoisomerase 4 subunit A [Burkholderia pseudomultivorans]MDR8745455.1 DNA topoisomerase 4 subunit A [Burkholderia pseudomultivorans]MDR8757678.1 DNA topoisomerase 4 subunit A [Burkholderia pseudomultivorans]MDR8781808.1 DNA topoisomerase 4 subunit A [Burkholderia pseudomultivorans]